MTSVRSASPDLVADLVRGVIAKAPKPTGDPFAMAIRAQPTWSDGELQVGDRRVSVTPGRSPLEVRAALADWKKQQDGGEAADVLVVLCDLTEAELGADVLARLLPPRVQPLDPWKAAAGLFGASRVDAAFRPNEDWIPEGLLRHRPPSHDATRQIGTLTRERAIDHLAEAVLGVAHLNADGVIEAAGHGQLVTRIDDPAATKLLDLLADHGGLDALVAAILRAGNGGDLLAIGLAARAVYGASEGDGGRAAGRLEARCGGADIKPVVGLALAQRCEEAVAQLIDTKSATTNTIVAAAAGIADDVGADHVEASDFLPAGFTRRTVITVNELAGLLDAHEASADQADQQRQVDAIGHAVDAVARHRATMLAGATRHTHVEMAARLAVWLTTPETSDATSFEEAADHYRATSSWVDWARRRLWRGDTEPEVAGVFRRILDDVAARRRRENQRFATLLAAWTTTPSSTEVRKAANLVTVEDVASEVLRPLARTAPLVFVVLDGCALASFNELADQFTLAGFQEITRTPSQAGDKDTLGPRLVGVAALPTVTEISRATLLAGALDQGNQDHERRAFAANKDLRVKDREPVLIHQSGLIGAAGSALSTVAEKAMGDGGPAVVGVVINTIDDQLKRGTFTRELELRNIEALDAVLDQARLHGRTVVVSADHGHVLAQPDGEGSGTFQRGGSGGERWRVADRAPNDHEVQLRGERVRLGGDDGILAPYDDDFRYAAKAGGYHGGATPAEVLVPVAVFTPAGLDIPSGWQFARPTAPLWWDLKLRPDTVAVPPAAPKPRRKPKPVDDAQPAMFDVPASPPAPPASTVVASEPAWLDALLASDVWKAQKSAAGRAALPEERVRRVLTVLDTRGGVASFAAIANETGIPLQRLAGFLSNLVRVLNVDGYPVLDVDANGSEARLEPAILAQQFEITVETR